MARFHSSGVRTITVEELDRVAHQLILQEAVIADIQKHGRNFMSVAEPDLMAKRSDSRSHAVAHGRGSTVRQIAKCCEVRKREWESGQRRHCEGRKPYGFYDGETAIIDRMN